MLKFKVENQTLTRTDSFVPVADSKNYLTAEFEFSDEWTGGIVAVFTRDGKPHQALLTDGKCTVPWEVIKAPGFYVSAFCGDLITADDVYIKVKAAGITDNDGAVVPTPSVWDDYIKQLAEENSELLDEKLGGAVDEAKAYADSAADTAEGNAKEYADSKASAAETAAKEYADGKADAALTAAKSYADTKASAAETAAKSYADSKSNTAEENAKEYADSIKPTKVSQLENDSGYLLSANAVGKKGTGEGAEIFNDYTNNQATGQFSHAEGYGAKAEGDASHAEGMDTVATGQGAHAEGLGTTASSGRAHAEGYSTVASGVQAHAEGSTTKASAESSHAEGTGTTASSTDQHVQGRWNIEDKNNKYAHIVGNGHQYAADPAVFSNAHTLDWNGVGWFAGGLKVGGSGQDDELAKDVATEEYVDTKLAEKADAYTITTAIENNTLLLADKSDTQLLSAAAAALTLTLPETVTSGYECFFSFKSGVTATTITAPSGITWTGADCNSGKEFVPLANTVYEVGIRCIGFASDGTPYLSARVGAC